METTIVLGSGSPRRRELLGRLGVTFEVVVPGVDESVLAGEDPAAYVERIAREKAAAVAAGGRVVVAADTSVVVDGDIVGKPDGPDGARAMLARLQGRRHLVVTAVAVASGGEILSEGAMATVEMRPMTATEIDWYVTTGEPLDKAGAYAAQGIGAAFVVRIDGDPTTVMGMPLSVTVDLLRRAGVDPIG